MWLTLFAAPVSQSSAIAENKTPNNEKIFLQAYQLTEIKPLQLRFLKGEVQLTENNRKMIQQWAKQIIKYNIPVFIHSFASAPTGIRNLDENTTRHEAIRVAFNRGLIAKNFLEQSGINQNRLILKASGPEQSEINDSITITTRRD